MSIINAVNCNFNQNLLTLPKSDNIYIHNSVFSHYTADMNILLQSYLNYQRARNYISMFFFCFKKALTVLHGPLAYPNGLLDLHIETYGRTPWPGDQPDARPLLTQDNTTQKHVDTHPCPKQDLNL
jgi:hypothetical protein